MGSKIRASSVNKFCLLKHVTAFVHPGSKHVQLVISAAAALIKISFVDDKDHI